MSGTRGQRITRTGLAQAGTDLSLAALFARFAWAHAAAFRAQPRPSVALVVVVETLFVVFFLARRASDAASRSPWDWLTTVCGSVAPLLLRPTQPAGDLLLGEAIQVFGTALSVLGMLSLNRSFGLVPAHRGVKTRGLYHLVRHPLYMAYTLSQLGYLLSNPTLRNGLIVAATFAFQLARIRNEERFLARYPEYREYQSHTRWRILPFVY
jgi:protein-S-isoprenylcysteine O-methyltransferase Ste14